MRRTDHDGYAARQRPPFKVLAVPDVAYLSPGPPSSTPPPPPRAPEPYKVAPSTTSFGRAHRRSSFVILAESRPATPESGDGSPPLPTGRVSPFRGRGFKGPPPRSRPQSPEVAADGRRRSRVERRVSVSQQNSPRRSLIPQPTYRQRSTSLTKVNDRSPSPKISRRVDSKTRLNVSNSRDRLNASDAKSTRLNDSRTRLNKPDAKSRTSLGEPRPRFISSSTSNLSSNSTTPGRRQTTRLSTRLSPIQGTPTKPEKTATTTQASSKGDRTRDSSRPPPAKTPRTSPQKSNAATRRDSQNRNTSKERVVSPSKIPLKTSKNGSFTTPSNTGRFISVPDQGSEAAKKANKADKIGKEGRHDQQADQSVQNGRLSEAKEFAEVNGSSSGQTDEVDIMGLLKQSSSHAAGTSSERLVNTTTSTAVKPLHIDANALLVERNDGRSSQPKECDVTKSSAASKDESPQPVSMQNAASTSEKPTSTMENQVRVSQTSSSGNEKRDSPVGTESTGGHSKSGSVGQPVKNTSRANGDGSTHQRPSNQSSANQRSTRNGQGTRGSKPADGKASEQSEVTSAPSAEVKSGSAGGVGKLTGGREASASDRMPTVMENDTKAASGQSEMRSTAAAAAAAAANNAMANSTTATNKVMNAKSNDSHASNSAGGAVNASANSGAVRARNENRGSDVSLKSSTGVSTDSIESVRSTDTGVSVNTVRGVSSPREKTGVHVVKRQEIETLSGNIVCVEQNGEPAVLASSNEKERDSERLLTRWGRSLSRYCKCCSGMRCLACRRDPKGLLWTRNSGRMTVISESPPPVAVAALDAPPPPPGAIAPSCWSKLKTRCRCTRLREFKCCARRSKVAPAEPTVCCPPERRFGTICRRVFGCCSCKRADKQQRTRNVRAKHSLTSVVPPPLSEEPKAKIPDVLVEHNSVMRGAIPCLPVPLAWFCLVWNVLLPGSGTVWSGLFNLCTGQPRFSPVAGLKSRLGAFIVNLVVGVGQLFTVLFCLVGWGWSIWWGVTMVRLARKYKRFRASEAASNDPEARGGEPAALPPGVPSQALRGIERAR